MDTKCCPKCGGEKLYTLPYDSWYCRACGREYVEVDGKLRRPKNYAALDYEANRDFVRESLNEGYSIAEIAEDVNLSVREVRKIITKEGYPMPAEKRKSERKTPWSSEDLHKLRELVACGYTHVQISGVLHRSVGSVSTKIRQFKTKNTSLERMLCEK